MKGAWRLARYLVDKSALARAGNPPVAKVLAPLIEVEDFRRAAEVQGQLAAKANHRAVSIPDLLIAAVAERHRVPVFRYDADFDLIAHHTAQSARWIVPRGSLT